MPVGNVLVSDTGGNVEHDDTALAVDVVTVTKTTELLLSRSIPDIELNVPQVLQSVSKFRHGGSFVALRTVLNPRG